MGNFLTWNVKRNPVLSVSFKGIWYDIGGLESYSEAQNWLEKRPQVFFRTALVLSDGQ